MNRYRICDNYSTSYNPKDMNDIYRKFQFQFSNMLNANEIARSLNDFEKIYIPDPMFEEQISIFMNSIGSMAQFCVGYTGIGKTTTIRHCFKLGVSVAPVLNVPSKLTQGKYMIIFPTFLNGYFQSEDKPFDLCPRISSVCTALENAHPDLHDIYKKFEELKLFFDFIQNHLPHILESGENISALAEVSEKEYILKKLDSAMRIFPLEYYTCKLKYYILKKSDIYDRLVIVLDDIEAMPESFQEQVIADYLHLFDCMQNTEYPQDSNYRVNLLISLRPHTYRIFSNGIYGRMLSAYSFVSPILKENSVDLNLLFKKRFDFYTEMSHTNIGNPESWERCYEQLMLVNSLFDGQFKRMISNLCFFNVRTSLAEYAKILGNRVWVQGNSARSEFFTISSDEYKFNDITVPRAIGCGNSIVFMGIDGFIIPNFFYTTPYMDYSIQCLLVMQYFHGKMQIFTGGGVEYGLDSMMLKDVYAEWKKVLDDEHVKQLNIAVQHLYECKILRKSIMDFEDYQVLDVSKSLKDTSRLYLSPRGVELMNMFRQSSVLLEMLRECAWHEYRGQDSNYYNRCSYELIQNGKQNELFIDLLEYIEMLCQAEEDFFFSPNGINLCAYREIFGYNLVVEGLMLGVEKSLRISGKLYNTLIAKKFNQVHERIEESKKTLWSDS